MARKPLIINVVQIETAEVGPGSGERLSQPGPRRRSELAVAMFPEDGCLHVQGVGDDGVTAFTNYGIECLRQIIADERALETHRRRSNQPSRRPAVLTGC
jgi:hypothetical protein